MAKRDRDISTSPFSEFINFILVVLRKRIFLFFLFLGIVAISLPFINPVFALPPIYYLGFVFVGFVGSAFQVYRDLSQAYQKALNPIPVEPLPRSELSISFVNGNEYAYSISDPYAGQNAHIAKMQEDKKVKSRFDEHGLFHIDDKIYYVMGKGHLEINLRIQNSGDLPLDVLLIDSDDNLGLNYLLIYNGGFYLHGRKVRFPFQLKSGELVELQSKYKISLNKGANNALFAADFRALPRSISHEILVNVQDVDGKKQTFVTQIKIPSKPLVDMYVKQWREYDQVEYLVLAGCSLKGDT